MKKILKLLSLFLLGTFVFPTVNFAGTENNIGFSIQAEIPDNQIDKKQSFFDLRMAPSQEQELGVQIINSSDVKSKFKVSVNQAYTNSSGFIDYAKSDVKKDSSLIYDISDIATYEPTIEVEANSSTTFPIKLKMPKEKYDGSIMAGIQVVKENENENKGITNKYGYILGLKLTETDVEIKRTLNLLSVKPAVSFSRTSVVAEIQNPTMDAFGHLKYSAKVTNKETGKIEKEVSYDENMQMAPNSVYDFAIDWDDKALVAGQYTLDLIVSDAKGNEWKFNKDFLITKKDAQEINLVTVDKTKEKAKIPIWLIILVLLIILLSLSIYISKKYRKSA